uniref:hypothetical protein n=1 Tax=Escherichia coli TaxID=562 RepID=UPI001BC89BE8
QTKAAKPSEMTSVKTAQSSAAGVAGTSKKQVKVIRLQEYVPISSASDRFRIQNSTLFTTSEDVADNHQVKEEKPYGHGAISAEPRYWFNLQGRASEAEIVVVKGSPYFHVRTGKFIKPVI